MKGLTSSEIKQRLEKYGYNELNEKEESAIKRLFKRFWGPIPWMIEVAALLSAFAKRWEDFSIIMILLLVNAIVDFYQESKALNAIAVLKQKLAQKALVLRDGKWSEILAKELVPDDIIKVKIGDIIPADVVFLEGSDFVLVDQSALTGESLPVRKKVGEEIYANAILKQGEMIAKVTKTAKNTYFGKTVGLVAKASKEEVSHFQKMVIKVGNFLIALTILMMIVIIYHGLQKNEPTMELLIFALVLTISAIPVAMPAVLTVTMAIGAKALAKRDAIVSRLAAIEELAGMDILCSDKTGTLTKNQMSLYKPYVSKNFSEDDLLLFAALASKEENNDPIERPIFEYLSKNNLKDKLKSFKFKKFLPFDPIHKRTEGIYEIDNEEFIYTKGAPQVIIEQCNEEDFDKNKAYEMVYEFASKGFRTIAVAYKKSGDEFYNFVGLLPLFDPPREDSKEAISQAKTQGVNVKMITGDNIAVAKYIASLLDIGENIVDIKSLKGNENDEYLYLSKILSKAITKSLMPDANEAEIEKITNDIVKQVKKELLNKPILKGSVKRHESEIIELIEQVDGFAQVFPEDKYYIVDKLQKANHIVGMTGDGVNDAPALKKADCGIAVSGATDAARAAADIVLLSPGLSVIVDAIKEARIIFERMKSYTIYRIAETIRVIIFMTLAIVVYNFYPITALMIIILALLNDIPIMAIAYDNTKLRNSPVRWDMKEIFVLSSWLGIAGVLSSFMLFWYLMSYKHLPLDLVQSIFFVKLIVAGHGTIFNTRIDDWFFKKPLPSSLLANAAFFSAVAGTIIGVYGFDLMRPIGWEWALFVWIYAICWFLFNDTVKMVILKYYRKKYHIDIM